MVTSKVEALERLIVQAALEEVQAGLKGEMELPQTYRGMHEA